MHLIFDFNHMFYKYKFRLEKGTLRKLSYEDKDISYIYYNLRDIESARKKYEKKGYEVFVHVCMDSKTKRKEESLEYKANRENKLSQDNFDDMQITTNLLRAAGYDVIKVEGYEADDIIWTLVHSIPSDENVVIYTNDSDVTVNVKDNTVVELYNSVKGNTEVTCYNFEMFMRQKLKSEEFMYNEIILYKSLVGDKADNVSGIDKFGVKAFDKLMLNMKPYMRGYEHLCSDGNYASAIIRKAHELEFLTDVQYKQAMDSFSLVVPRVVDGVELVYKKSSYGSRERAYSKYEMKSLYE